MSRYNKAVGSSSGGLIGILLGIAIIAGLNYINMEITPDIQTLILALSGVGSATAGTYLAPKNSE